MTKVSKLAITSKANGKVNGKTAPVAVITMSAGQKSAATKLRMKADRIAAEKAALLAYASMSPGQKAAHTKRLQASKANGHTAPVATTIAPVALDYAAMSPGQKAAHTKRLQAGKVASAAPVATTIAPVATTAPAGMDLATFGKLLSLVPSLRLAGLI